MSYVSAPTHNASSALAQPRAGERARRILFYLAAAAVVLTMVVVVLGAFTRLRDAGLGCPDWPGCYGHLTWPRSEGAIERAEARFPEFPVEHDKTWPEMVHRYFASLLGLVIFAILWLAWRWRQAGADVPLRLPLLLALVVVVQGAFGAWTVTLKLWPQVVTAHLLGGFATLSLLWLLTLRLSPWQRPLVGGAWVRRLATIGFFAVIVQIALGGWTSANYAAVACPDLPTCHGVWWPPADYAQGFNIFQQVGPNYLGGLLDNHARTAIHFVHRLGALAVTLLLLLLVAALAFSREVGARLMAVAVLLALTVQVALGISNVYWALPLPVAVAHNAFGAVLLLVLVTLKYRLFRATQIQEPSRV